MAGMFKHCLRTHIDHTAAFMRILPWHERRMRSGLTILMYHRILPAAECEDYPLATLVMPDEHFREQVRWLREHCDVRTVGDAVDELQSNARRDRPLVALTFDDGYADNAEFAAPILEEFGVRGTFFVTTGFVGSGGPLWFDRAADAWTRLGADDQAAMLAMLNGQNHQSNGHCAGMLPQWMARLKRLRHEQRIELVQAAESHAAGTFDADRYAPMNAEQVCELHERGHEVASHSVTHQILPLLSDEELTEELQQSHDMIRQWTGSDAIGFCYPNGDVDDRVERAVLAAGYRYACMTRSDLNRTDTPPTRLGRIDITRHRVLNHRGHYDEIAFRSEVCRLREWWRSSNGATS